MVRLANVELVRLLGRGGAGSVWAATHLPSRTPVAVKIMHDTEISGLGLASFAAEAEAVAALDHPHIIRLYDFGTATGAEAAASGGTVPAGAPYLVTELARDATLMHRLATLDWPRTRQILTDLLGALAHAHARRIIHRDIKPSNVLVGVDGRLLLADFGLAFHRAPDPVGPASSTASAGTPNYMAPEQIAGTWRVWGPVTDLYALGCLAWTMVSGTPPFYALDGVRLSGPQVLYRHLNQPVPRLVPRMDVPDGLEDWLRQLLAKAPGRRFACAADAAWALDGLGAPSRAAVSDAPLDDGIHHLQTTRVVSPHMPETGSEGSLAGPRAVPPMPRGWRAASRARRIEGLELGPALWGLRRVRFVGRERERDALWSALGSVRDSGGPRCVVLRGAAGIGKSAVARWLAERAAEVGAASVLEATHAQVPGPHCGITGLLARHLACDGLSAEEARAHLLAAGRDLDDAAGLARVVASDVAPVPRDVRHGAAMQVLVEEAWDRPVLLVIDDAQWGPDALGFARRVLTRRVAALVVVAVRDESLGEDPDAARALVELCGQPGVHTMALEALPPERRAALVREMLYLDAAGSHVVAEKSSGNPRLAEAWVGDLLSRGLLVPGPAGLELRGEVGPLSDPATAMWERRLDAAWSGADGPTRQGMELAAVLGETVHATEWRRALRAAAIDVDMGDIVSTLVRQRLAIRGRDGAWSFANPLLAEVLRGRAHHAGRLSAHHRVCADILDPTPANAERRAHHLVAADAWWEAVEPLLHAARNARSRGDLGRALALFRTWEEASARCPNLPTADRVTGWMVGLDVLRVLGRVEEADRLLDAVVTATSTAGLDTLRAQVLLDSGIALRGEGRFDDAARVLEEALEASGADPELTASIWYQLGWVADMRGSFADAEAAFGTALRLNRKSGDEQGECATLRGLATTAYRSGRVDEARAHATAALELARPRGFRLTAAHAHMVLGEIARHAHDLPEADHHYQRAREGFTACFSRDVHLAELNLVALQLEEDRFDEARPLADRCVDAFAASGDRVFEAAALLCQLVAAAGQGDRSVLEPALARASTLLDRTGFVDPDAARWAHRAAALLDALGAGALARRAAGIAHAQDARLRSLTP